MTDPESAYSGPRHRPISPRPKSAGELPKGPVKAMIEIARACNLRCPLCPVGNGIAQRYPNMSRKTFERIICAIAPTVKYVCLYNYGEPLIHPEVADFVGFAKAAGIDVVEITTNGTLVRDGLPEALLDAGLDFLRFSIDGATEYSYGAYRVGGSLEIVWQNMERFRAIKLKSSSRIPFIEAQMIVNRFNEAEINLFTKLAQQRGADSVRFKTFNTQMSGPEYAAIGRSFLPMEARLSRYLEYDRLTLRETGAPTRCHWPWERLVINADGTIVPCCYDFNGEHRLGSAEDLRHDWWMTPERALFRQRLRGNPSSIGMCSICPLGGRNIPQGAKDGIHELSTHDRPIQFVG